MYFFFQKASDSFGTVFSSRKLSEVCHILEWRGPLGTSQWLACTSKDSLGNSYLWFIKIICDAAFKKGAKSGSIGVVVRNCKAVLVKVLGLHKWDNSIEHVELLAMLRGFELARMRNGTKLLLNLMLQKLPAG